MIRIMGVDIGTYSVKVAQLEVHTKSFQITGYREYLLNQDPNHDRHLATIEILRGLATQYASDEFRFVLAVPQSGVSLRQRTFPFKERRKILKSLPFELEDEVPIDSSEALYEAKLTQSSAGATTVLACVVPKNNVASLLNLATDGNIDPEIITVEAFAFANSVENPLAALPNSSGSAAGDIENGPVAAPANDSKATVYLHMGHSGTLISFYRGPMMLASRQILWGGRDIADHLARKYQLPLIEAIKVLEGKGFILTNEQGRTRDEIIFSNTIKEAFEPLIIELRLALLDMKAEFNLEIEQVLVSGGVSLLPHLCPYLTQSLELQVNIYNHLKRYNSLPFDSGNSKIAMTSNIALGLAFEAMKRPRNPPVNLRSEEFSKKSRSFQQIWEKWNYTAKVVAIAFVAFCVYSVIRDNLASTLSDAADNTLRNQAKTLAKLTGSRASESAIRRFVNDREREIKARETMKQVRGMTSALDIVKKISELTPAKSQVQVDIRHLEVVRETLTIRGLVGAPAQIEALKKAWQSLSSDNQVRVIPSQPATGSDANKTPFHFQLRVQRWSGGAS